MAIVNIVAWLETCIPLIDKQGFTCTVVILQSLILYTVKSNVIMVHMLNVLLPITTIKV